MDAKEIVKRYLDERAKDDEMFAKAYADKKKSMDECWKYILSEARKRGSAVCMRDAEVFGLAVHYYDEKDIKVEECEESVEAMAIGENPGKTKEPGGSEKPKKKRYTKKEVEEKRKKIDEMQLDLFG